MVSQFAGVTFSYLFCLPLFEYTKFCCMTQKCISTTNVSYATDSMCNLYIHISNRLVHIYAGMSIYVYIQFLGILYTYVLVPCTIATATVMPLKIGIMVNITFKCFTFWNYEKHALNWLFSFNEYCHFNLYHFFVYLRYNCFTLDLNRKRLIFFYIDMPK